MWVPSVAAASNFFVIIPRLNAHFPAWVSGLPLPCNLKETRKFSLFFSNMHTTSLTHHSGFRVAIFNALFSSLWLAPFANCIGPTIGFALVGRMAAQNSKWRLPHETHAPQYSAWNSVNTLDPSLISLNSCEFFNMTYRLILLSFPSINWRARRH